MTWGRRHGRGVHVRWPRSEAYVREWTCKLRGGDRWWAAHEEGERPAGLGGGAEECEHRSGIDAQRGARSSVLSECVPNSVQHAAVA
jgi:hypothetical protein